MNASDARLHSTTKIEDSELLEIRDEILEAAHNKKTQILREPFSTYLIRNVVEKDWGYTIRSTRDGNIIISW